MYFSCYDFEYIGEFAKEEDHCGTCHIDKEEYDYYMCTVTCPSKNKKSHKAEVCCNIKIKYNKLTEKQQRQVWAKILKSRKYNRNMP